MIKVIFVFSSVGNLQGFAIVTREVMNNDHKCNWYHEVRACDFNGVFLLVCLKVEIKNINVKNR